MTVKEVLEVVAKIIEDNDIQNIKLQEKLYVLALRNREYPDCFQTLLPAACESTIRGHEFSFDCINCGGYHQWTCMRGNKIVIVTLDPLQYNSPAIKNTIYRAGHYVDNTIVGYITLDPHKPDSPLGFEPINEQK